MASPLKRILTRTGVLPFAVKSIKFTDPTKKMIFIFNVLLHTAEPGVRHIKTHTWEFSNTEGRRCTAHTSSLTNVTIQTVFPFCRKNMRKKSAHLGAEGIASALWRLRLVKHLFPAAQKTSCTIFTLNTGGKLYICKIIFL